MSKPDAHSAGRDDKVTIPRIDTNIITTDDIVSIKFPQKGTNHGHPLYDFEYSWRSISKRLCIINDLILDFENSFNDLQQHVASVEMRNRDPLVFSRYIIRGEALIGTLRTSADQLLSLLWILKKKSDTGVYDDKIDNDCIGRYLNDGRLDGEVLGLIEKHAPLLREINDAANGAKHSFLNLHVNTYQTEPSALVYLLPQNKTGHEEGGPVTISFKTDIPEYNEFIKDIKKLISEYAQSISTEEPAV